VSDRRQRRSDQGCSRRSVRLRARLPGRDDPETCREGTLGEPRRAPHHPGKHRRRSDRRRRRRSRSIAERGGGEAHRMEGW
jgi:hypothetical protein